MRIIITEEQKKKLFIPRKLSGEDSRWSEWNKEQPIIDGVKTNQYNINTGKKEGYWETYDRDGNLASKGNYVDGKADGYWEWYHENGKLYEKGHYKNGEMVGYWEWYYTNGQLRSKGSYKNGKRDGYWEFYSYNRYKWYLLRKGRYIDGIFYDE